MYTLALSLKDAAKAVGVSTWTLTRMVKRGELLTRRAGRRVLFPMEALKKWLEGK